MKAKLSIDELSRGFDAGNFANAYVSEDLDTALEKRDLSDRDERDPYRQAFILGFFSSYALHEISQTDRDSYDSAYFSEVGRHALERGYMDDRAEEYAAEQE